MKNQDADSLSGVDRERRQVSWRREGLPRASPLTHPARVPPGANELSLHMRTSPHVRETSSRNATVSDERPWTVVGSESIVSTGTREGAGTEAAGEKEHWAAEVSAKMTRAYAPKRLSHPFFFQWGNMAAKVTAWERRRPVKTGRNWRCAATGQAAPRTAGPRSWERGPEFFLRGPGRNQPCPHLDFRLLTSRTEREFLLS